MISELLCDLSKIDLFHTAISKSQIYDVNPQRHEFEQIDGIINLNIQDGIIVGFKNVNMNEYWVKGHIPGRPVMPGVLLLETAGQLCGYMYKMTVPEIKDKFIVFAGIDDVRFRTAVIPDDRLILIGKRGEMNSRIMKCKAQGLVNGKPVFDCAITGMALKG